MIGLKTSSFTGLDLDDNGQLDPTELRTYVKYVKNLDSDVLRLFTFIQGNLSFGATANLKRGQNIFGQWATVADTGSANTEFVVPHTLSSNTVGIIPGNYFITKINKGGVVYTSGTTWTTSNIYLKCSAANAALNIFITR